MDAVLEWQNDPKLSSQSNTSAQSEPSVNIIRSNPPNPNPIAEYEEEEDPEEDTD